MSETLLKDRPVSDADRSGDVQKTSLDSASGKEFSLTSGAKTLQLNRNTLRAAIESGELPATKNAKGHYVIQSSQLFQWSNNRQADEVRRVADRPEAIPRPLRDVQKNVQKTGVSGASFDPLGTSFDEGDPRIQVLLLKQENSTLKDANQRLEGEVQTWQGQADKWQAPTENYKFLLTDERDIAEKLKSKLAAEQAQTTRSKAPLAAAVVLVVAASIAMYLYPDTVRELLRGQGAPVVDVTMLEAVPELEPVATADQKIQDTNPPR